MEFKTMENNYRNENYNNGYQNQNNGYNGGGYRQQNNDYRRNNYQNNRYNDNRPKREPPKNAYTIYTDGGCFMKANPPIGAWAFVDPQNNEFSKSEAVENTTNNQMELTAAIEALKYLHNKVNNEGLKGPFMIKSDSMYVVKGSAFWIKNWKKNDWKRVDRDGNVIGDVQNVELWKQIDSLSNGLDVWWTHVDGHSGDKYNEMCDHLVKTRMNNFVAN